MQARYLHGFVNVMVCLYICLRIILWLHHKAVFYGTSIKEEICCVMLWVFDVFPKAHPLIVWVSTMILFQLLVDNIERRQNR